MNQLENKQKKQTTNKELSDNNSYLNLLIDYSDALKADEKSSQEIKNVFSAVNLWCSSLRIDVATTPGKELLSEFENSIKQFKRAQAKCGKSPSTYNSRISLIKNFRKFYLQNAQHTSLPENFGDRLKYFLDSSSYAPKSFWEHHLSKFIKYGTFKSWLARTCIPANFNRYVIEIIEEKLSIRKEELTSLLKKIHNTHISQTSTKFGDKIKRLRTKEYCMWTKSLQDEFNDLLKFKTAIIPPDGMKRSRRGIWNIDSETENCSSAKLAKSRISAFVGYCHLAEDADDVQMRGLGLKEETLSLALLVKSDYVEQFISVFKLARNDNKYNNNEIEFLTFVISLLRETTGYIFQKTELAEKIELPLEPAIWQSRCLEVRNRLVEIRESIRYEKKSGGRGFALGRDPEEPIREILETDRPLFALFKLSEDILQDVKKITSAPLRQAILFRDLVLIKLLQANPLRITMVSSMKLNKNFIKDADGSWWLSFKRENFKNRRFLKRDYLVRVAPDLWELIDDYLNIYRPLLLGEDKSEYVFLPSRNHRAEMKDEMHISGTSLSNAIFKRTKQYISGCKGFRAHAFRHIVATDIIKSNPAMGISLAAITLHDSEEIVRMTYAHLLTNDRFEVYNSFFSDAQKSFKSKNQELDKNNKDLVGGKTDDKTAEF